MTSTLRVNQQTLCRRLQNSIEGTVKSRFCTTMKWQHGKGSKFVQVRPSLIKWVFALRSSDRKRRVHTYWVTGWSTKSSFIFSRCVPACMHCLEVLLKVLLHELKFESWCKLQCKLLPQTNDYEHSMLPLSYIVILAKSNLSHKQVS